MTTGNLRKCPACHGPIEPGQMGLRDYNWWISLPKKVGPMDIDFLLERRRHFLSMEFKPSGMLPSRGMEITFEEMRALGMETWTIEGDKPFITREDMVKVWWNPDTFEEMTVAKLESKVLDWYDIRSRSERRGG